jgi:RimJ/RimL family protein N-acetyltransferase
MSSSPRRPDPVSEAAVSIARIERDDRAALEPIVKDETVMRSVKTCKPWTDKVLDAFMNEARSSKPWSWHWKVQVNVAKVNVGNEEEEEGEVSGIDTTPAVIVGVVSIQSWRHAPLKSWKYFVTRFFDKEWQGRGVGTQALRLALREFHAERPDKDVVYALAESSNTHAIRSALKVGFVEEDTTTWHDKEYTLCAFRDWDVLEEM